MVVVVEEDDDGVAAGGEEKEEEEEEALAWTVAWTVKSGAVMMDGAEGLEQVRGLRQLGVLPEALTGAFALLFSLFFHSRDLSACLCLYGDLIGLLIYLCVSVSKYMLNM